MGCSELNGKPYKPSPGLAAAMPLGHFRIILINTFKNNRHQAGLTGYVVRIFKNMKYQNQVTGYAARIFKNMRCQHLATGYVARIFLGWARPESYKLQARKLSSKKNKKLSKVPSGWARPVYINRHPQPPAKDIG